MSIESEHADMAERLRAIAQIVNGGVIVGPGVSEKPQIPTAGCNCKMSGVLLRTAHEFGCPYGGPGLREAPARAL